MEVRVLYTMEMYIEGKDLNECREKWEESNLADGEFVELNAVEDADTYDEISVWDFEHSKPNPYITSISTDGSTWQVNASELLPVKN